MINIVNDNILNAKEKIIGHQTNCYTIGSGVSYDIIKKYPKVKLEHKLLCNRNDPDYLLGKVQMIDCGLHIVANIFGQKNYGKDKNIRYSNYNAIEVALEHLFSYASRNNIDVALPYNMGCERGNGDWNIVKKIIKKVQKQTGANITLYRYHKS